MRRKPMRRPDTLHRTQADVCGLGHGPTRPMGGLAGWFAERQINDAFDDFREQRRFSRRTSLVAQETVDALAHEALLPAPDNRLRQPGPPHDLYRAASVGGGHNDPRASCMLLRTVMIPDDPIETCPILGRAFDNDPCSHFQSMNQITALGNPPNVSFR